MGLKKEQVFSIYRFLFARKRFYKLNKALFALSLRGLGLFNFGDETVTGEDFFLRNVLVDVLGIQKNLIIVDVGANEGSYAGIVKKIFPESTVYAFEPHPKTFERLQEKAGNLDFRAFNLALGEKSERMKLFDYAEEELGSEHASLYKDVFEKIWQSKTKGWDVKVARLDEFADKFGIEKINLLKIDTEGHEAKILAGAQRLIEKNAIDLIHFEFNEMNIVSRTFFRDFFELLPNYRFFRMLKDGLIPLGEYSPLRFELFGYQNIVAIRDDIFP